MGSIGIFDSGYGGLTVLKEIVKELPQYHYTYLGDNARAPYGNRSFETVYEYTWQCVQWFFNQGCSLVILACNTASAKALRNIQQHNLPALNDISKRVLGVIRPTTEVIGSYSTTGCVGIVGTSGTIQSNSYLIEIAKFFPQLTVYQEACPMWVPLIENNEHNNAGADYFVQQHLESLFQKNKQIDTLLLACTHYPLFLQKLQQFIPSHINIVAQGSIVAKSLAYYLNRHPTIEQNCLHQPAIDFYTTDNPADFDTKAAIFWGNAVRSKHAAIV